MAVLDQTIFGGGEGVFDDLAQTADIVWPGMGHEPLHGFLGDGRGVAIAVEGDEVGCQVGNILAPGAQGWHLEGLPQAVEEVLAELPLRHGLGQIAIGSSYTAQGHLFGAGSPNGADLAAVQGAQQLGLGAEGQFADFVQKEGASRSRLKEAGSVGGGTGEGSLV